MLTQEIKDFILSLIPGITEQVAKRAAEINLLALPETVGSMLKEQAIHAKLNSDFYNKHPQLKKHKQIVMSVIEKIDAENPGMEYDKITQKAVPQIENIIRMQGSLNMDSVNPNPNTDFNGVL